MARLLNVVYLTAPANSTGKNINDTFTMTEYFTTTGTGTQENVNLYWQQDQGIATWIDIATTGTTQLTASTGAQLAATRDTNYSRTITCKSAGAYVIRAKAVGSSTKYSVNTPTITIASGPTLQSIAGSLAVGGMITVKTYKEIKGVEVFTGSLTKNISKNLSGTLDILGELFKKISILLEGTLTFISQIYKTIIKIFHIR